MGKALQLYRHGPTEQPRQRETLKTPYLKGEGLKGRNPQGHDSGPCEGPYKRASSSIEDQSQASGGVAGRTSVGDGNGMGEDRLAAAASAASCTAAPAGKRDGPFDTNGHGARNAICKLASRRGTHSMC